MKSLFPLCMLLFIEIIIYFFYFNILILYLLEIEICYLFWFSSYKANMILKKGLMNFNFMIVYFFISYY
jgi:hypothetical protein